MRQEDLIALFVPALGRDRFLTENTDLAYYGKDACKDFTAAPSLIFLPQSTDEVSLFLKICNERGIAVVPSGGRTGYSAGATALAGEVVLSLERLNKILDVSPDARTMTCQAGVKTEAVIEEAKKHGLFYGVDFASKGSSHIGGNAATNAGGIRVIRYGNTRQWVIGLTVVLADGTILRLNGELLKNQTGYDIRHLFIGSEGTLGVIVEVILKLESQPGPSATALCGFDSARELVQLFGKVTREGYSINVIEYFDSLSHDYVTSLMGLRSPFQERYGAYGIMEVDIGMPDHTERFQALLLSELENGTVRDVVVAQTPGQRSELMALRERISECTLKHFVPHKNDISVPVRHVPSFIDDFSAEIRGIAPGLKFIIFGHVGDGNLHIHLLKPESMKEQEFFEQCREYDRRTFEIVRKYGGSVSAEHGVGLLKKDYLDYSRDPREIELMRGIKKVFDPRQILNPGKIFD